MVTSPVPNDSQEILSSNRWFQIVVLELNASQGTGAESTSSTAVEWRADRRKRKRPSATDPGIRGGAPLQVRKGRPGAHQGASLMERQGFRRKVETQNDCPRWGASLSTYRSCGRAGESLQVEEMSSKRKSPT